MRVTRIDHANDDLTVVNAARVSMDKMVDTIVKSGTPEADERKLSTGMAPDDGLINYLVKNNHWTPLGHARHRYRFKTRGNAFGLAMWANKAPGAAMEYDFGSRTVSIEDSLWGWLTNPAFGFPSAVMTDIKSRSPICYEAVEQHIGIDEIPSSGWVMDLVGIEEPQCVSLLIEAPIFVFRQLMRSNVGIVYNEVSRRYVDDEPEFFEPDKWRARPHKSIKQGSAGELEQWKQRQNDLCVERVVSGGLRAYETLIARDTAPEQARMILPQNMMTKLWMTATNEAMERVLKLREDSHAQKEIRDLAAMMRAAIEGRDTHFEPV